MVRRIFAFILAALVAYLLSCLAMTSYTLQEYADIGLTLTPATMLETYWLNVQGLAEPAPGQPVSFAVIQVVGLMIAFLVAGGVKRIIRPLAPFAYPVAGLVALPVLIILIENVMIGGGVGAFFGARGPLGLALQGGAGLVGGLVFALVKGTRS